MVRAEVSEGSISRRLRNIRKLRDEKESLAERMKQLNKDIESQTERCLDEMLALGIDGMSIEMADGRRFRVHPTTRKSARVTDRAAFFEWCGREGIDVEMVQVVNSAKVKTLYSERDEHGESLPDGVEIFPQTTFTFTKKASK